MSQISKLIEQFTSDIYTKSVSELLNEFVKISEKSIDFLILRGIDNTVTEKKLTEAFDLMQKKDLILMADFLDYDIKPMIISVEELDENQNN